MDFVRQHYSYFFEVLQHKVIEALEDVENEGKITVA